MGDAGDGIFVGELASTLARYESKVSVFASGEQTFLKEKGCRVYNDIGIAVSGCDAVIDCGLKYELLTVNALAASDYCIIPVQAHFLASEGIPEVLDLVRSVQSRFNPILKIAGILVTMYQSKPQLCESIRETVVDVYGTKINVFERPIEYSIKLAECPAAGQSIFAYRPRNPAAASYRHLAQEVLQLE